MTNIMLRELEDTKADAKLYRTIAYGDQLYRFLPLLCAKTTEESRKILASSTRAIKYVGIFNDNTLVGLIRSVAYGSSKKGYVVDLTYFIGERFCRKGFGSAGVKLFIDKTKEFAPLVERITFTCRRENTASIALAKSVGAHETGRAGRYVYFEYTDLGS